MSKPVQNPLQIIVDNKQFNVYLELILLAKTLQRKHFIFPDGTERLMDIPLYDPKLSIALPTTYTTVDHGQRTEFEGWDAIVKKLSTMSGISTLPTTKEEMLTVVGNAIRTRNYRGNPSKNIVISICVSTDLSEREPLPEIKDPKIRKKAHWTDFKITEMITPNQYFIKKGGNISNIPIAPKGFPKNV